MPNRLFFTTPRLEFRRFEVEDLDALAAIVADPDVVRFTDDGLPLSREKSALWIERSRANVARFGYGTGALIERGSGRMIGWAGFARPEDGPEEIVYGFAKDAWGQGYGTEIARGLVDYAFGPLGHREVRATVAPANEVSRRILGRLGFVQKPWEHDAEALLLVLAKDGTPPPSSNDA